MYAKVNGYKIYFDVEGLQYVSEGAVMRERPVCLALHGGPAGDHTHYLPDLSPLSKYCQIVYIDDRECGLSDHLDPAAYSIRRNAEDVEALREYLGLDKVFILGHSYGGMKAQYYAAHYPEHLYGVMIVASAARAADVSPERRDENIDRYAGEEGRALYDRLMADFAAGKIDMMGLTIGLLPLYHGKGKFKGQETIDNFLHETYNMEVLNDPANDFYSFDLTADIETIGLPCLVAAGDRDILCSLEANRYIADHIPGAEFHILENTSHDAFADSPEVLLPLLGDFMERHFKK